MDLSRYTRPSAAVAGTLQAATECLRTGRSDRSVSWPGWLWDSSVGDAPDVQMLATSYEAVVQDLGRLAQVARQQVVGTVGRVVGWPPAPSTLETAAAPNARGVVDHSIALGIDRRWLSVGGDKDTFNLAARIPLDVRIVDRRIVAVTRRDSTTAASSGMLVTTDKAALRAAQRYVATILPTSTPLQPCWRNDLIRPTYRQLTLLHLMAHNLTDESIATEMGLSDRQIRAEVSSLYQTFAVHSRFSLGVAYASWNSGA